MVATFSLLVFSVAIAYFSFLQVQIARKSEGRNNEKKYVYILLICFIASYFWFLINVNIIFPLDLIIVTGYLSMCLFFYAYHILFKRILKMKGKKMKEIDHEFQDKKYNIHEAMRKFFHFFLFGGCILYLLIYFSITSELIRLGSDFGVVDSHPVEGTIIGGFNEEIIPAFVSLQLYMPDLFQVAMIIFFMILIPFVILAEYFRLNPRLGIPFQALFLKSLRESEQNNPGHYYYFTMGLFIASVFLPVAGLFGMLCLLTFGDSAASLVGKRINKKHCIRWEPEKCWEGAVAGFFFTFITAMFFVGWILAIILGIIFISIDVVTPEKLKVSDNFLYPLLSVLILYLIITLGFQINAPIANILDEMLASFQF